MGGGLGLLFCAKLVNFLLCLLNYALGPGNLAIDFTVMCFDQFRFVCDVVLLMSSSIVLVQIQVLDISLIRLLHILLQVFLEEYFVRVCDFLQVVIMRLHLCLCHGNLMLICFELVLGLFSVSISLCFELVLSHLKVSCMISVYFRHKLLVL